MAHASERYTTAATAMPTATTSTASNYQDAKYNFKFALTTGATIASQTDNDGRVDLPISSGTNLHEKYIQVSVRENVNPCVSPETDGVSTTTETKTFNNIQFTKQTGQGHAAGQIYDWVAYSTLRNTACISMTFYLHSVNPGVYTTPPPVFDMSAESAVFEVIMTSFNWITP